MAQTASSTSNHRLQDDLRSLSQSPRELWLVYGIKFLESLAYFAIYNLLVVYLSEDLAYNDTKAGTIAGTWLTVVSVLMFLSGFVADAMGIRNALLLAVTSCLLGRGMMALAPGPEVAMVGLFVSAWGTASMLPTMTAGIRRYTDKHTVSFGFSLFYVLMNVGALVAPLTLGTLREWFKTATTFDVPLLGPTVMSSSQIVFVISTVATMGALGLVLAMRRDADVPDRHDVVANPSTATHPLAILREVAAESAFWRFLLFVSLLVLVRLVFQHAHLTWPKYTQREIAPDFNFAYYWSINPAMIIVLTPVVTALTRQKSAFWCIVGGALVTTSSVFWLAASSAIWAQIAFVVTLSLGEALWSPRLYEYTAVVAPPGREASYMGLSQIPMFLAKPVVGWLSGQMLMHWCPPTGPRDSQTMWLVIGLSTLVGPLAIVALRKVIERRPTVVAVG
jgi:MFS family permease